VMGRGDAQGNLKVLLIDEGRPNQDLVRPDLVYYPTAELVALYIQSIQVDLKGFALFNDQDHRVLQAVLEELLGQGLLEKTFRITGLDENEVKLLVEMLDESTGTYRDFGTVLLDKAINYVIGRVPTVRESEHYSITA